MEKSKVIHRVADGQKNRKRKFGYLYFTDEEKVKLPLIIYYNCSEFSLGEWRDGWSMDGWMDGALIEHGWRNRWSVDGWVDACVAGWMERG